MFLLFLFCVCIHVSNAQEIQVPFLRNTLPVLGIFANDANVPMTAFNTAIENTYSKDGRVKLTPIIVSPTAYDSFSVWKSACTKEHTRPVAVFGPQIPYSEAGIQDACRRAGVPYLQATWLPPDPELDLNTPPLFPMLNYYPNADDIAKATAALLDYYGWSSFTILYEDDLGLIRVQKLLAARDINNGAITIRQLNPHSDNRQVFKELQSMHESKVLIDCHVDRIKGYLEHAGEVNMLNEYQGFIIPNLETHTLNLLEIPNLNANVTWLTMISSEDRKMPDDELQKLAAHLKYKVPLNSDNEKENITSTKTRLESILVYDLGGHLAASMANAPLHEQGFVENPPPNLCRTSQAWNLGPVLMESLLMTKHDGYSGNIEFDKWGRRTNFTLYVDEIINGDEPITVAKWDSRTNELIYNKQPSEAGENVVGGVKKNKNQKHFRVISRIAEPYLKYKNPPSGSNSSNDRFEGYSLNLMQEIINTLNKEGNNYSFEFLDLESNDTSYGHFDKNTKQWDGLIGMILAKKADLAICDLTITEERRKVVDFSVPFMTLGISILFRKETEEAPETFSFLNPFSVEVWLYTATAYFVVSIALYIASRVSPADWENPQPCDKDPEELENIWDFKNCTWLTIGSIMTQGCDILPKAPGSRWVTGMWWFFTMIVVQTYIAQLAASLTSNRQETPINSVEDLANQRKIQYGVFQDGSTARFFETSSNPMYQKMWNVMETSRPSVFTKSGDEGARRVLHGKNLYAFFMESITIEYMRKRKCELIQVGGLLDRKDYGIAMPANSPFRTDINRAILTLQESGDLVKIKKEWWSNRFNAVECPSKDREDVEGDLEIENLIGCFLVLGVGCTIAVIISFFEFYNHVRNIVIKEKVPQKEAFLEELRASLNLTQLQKPVLKNTSSASSSSTTSSHTTNETQSTRSRSRTTSLQRNVTSSLINFEKEIF